MFFHNKKSPHTQGCLALHLVIVVLLGLATLASLVGVYMAHFIDDSMVFGTTSGSLALIAFAFTLTMWMYQMRACVSKCEMCGGK